MNKKPTIVFKRGILNDIGQYVSDMVRTNNLVIIGDKTVLSLYGTEIINSLKQLGIKVFVFELDNGEKSKTLKTVEEIYQFMAQNHVTRKDVIVSLGGGATCDVTGFVACTYMRGLDFIQVPTTLLAQVDACIGGKNAVNLSAGSDKKEEEIGFKNIIGSFYLPKAVLIDPCVIDALPCKLIKDGMAEVIKYGAVYNESLFRRIYEVGFDESMILECVKIKTSITEKDFFDKGRRRILNFGHTIAHAIEKVSSYKVTHGEAVSIGMSLMTKLGQEMRITQKGTYEKITEVLKKEGLPVRSVFKAEQIHQAICLDKKAFDDNKIEIVLLKKIGEAIVTTLEISSMIRYINNILDNEK